MARIEVLMPKMGESVTEGTVTSWLKSVGETVEAEESIVEIATDKVDNELPSPASGTLVEILKDVDEVAQVGEVIAIISSDVDAPSSNGVSAPAAPVVEALEATQEVAAAAIANQSVQEAITTVTTADFSGGDRFYSPLVRNIAKTEGISRDELDRVPGSGANGRLTKKDLLNYVANRPANGSAPVAAHAATTVAPPAPAAPAPTAKAAPTPTAAPAPATSVNGDVEIIEMDRMRKLIADHMVKSMQTSPHVTSFVEADVTNLVLWRNRVKKKFQEREGEKITFTPLFIEAIVKAIKDFPMINISVDGNNIVRKKSINVGMAAALPSGNLIVPVIKNADRLNLVGLAKTVNDLANRARANKLAADEIQGGTYTVTNVGTFGNVMGTPIINQPQVAIMATGAIRKKPVVIETLHGDTIGIRHMMFLSHSYDHRVVDGALGGMFVRRVADYLEQFNIDRDI